MSVPAWLAGHIEDARGLFGLGGPEWHIGVEMRGEPGGDDACAAMTWPNATYLNAHIHFQRDLEDGPDARAYAFHEVMHIAHAEIDAAVDEALARVPTKKLRRLLRARYQVALERFIQRVTRNMLARLGPMPEEEEAADGGPTG